jgi:hypothetical protein
MRVRRSTTRRIRHDEGGIYSVLFVILLGVFIMAGALAVDMGALYFTRHATQSVADMAATAGGMELEPSDIEAVGTPAGACQAAWEYAVTNLRDASNTAPHPCGGMPSSGLTCDPTTPTTVTGTTGPYTISISWPVPDDDPRMDSHDTEVIDGSPCQRVAVTVQRDNDLLLGGFAGGGNQSTIGASAVARAQAGLNQGDLVALVVLHRTDCDALTTAGQGNVLVQATQVTDGDGNQVWVPGAITVDSDGTTRNDGTQTCQVNSYAIDANTQGAGSSWIIAENTPDGAPGVLLSHAALVNPAKAVDTSKCGSNGSDRSTRPVQPCPVSGNRITRAPIDHRYNCKTTYPSALGIVGCPGAASNQNGDYIDQLRTRLGGFASTPIPSGFSVYPTDYLGTKPSDPCVFNSPTTVTLPAGNNWFINCPNTGGSGNQPGFRMNNNDAVFEAGPGEIVFAGSLDLGSGTFTIGNDTQQSILYVRPYSSSQSGDIAQNDVAVTLRNTFVYLQDGAFVAGGNSGPIFWVAPDDDNFVFDDLALWSDSTDLHQVGGKGNVELEGTFFMPNAQFRYGGQGAQQQARAQFVASRLQFSGQGELVMKPDPERSTAVAITGVTLIR